VKRTPLQRHTQAWILATSTTPSGRSTSHLESGSAAASPVFDVVLTAAERALLEALNALPLERVIVSKRAAKRPKRRNGGYCAPRCRKSTQSGSHMSIGSKNIDMFVY